MNGPLIATERVELWQPAKGDMAPMHDIVANPRTGRFLGDRSGGMADQFQRFSRNAGSWFLYGYGSFTVRPRGSDEIIGTCGVFHSWRGVGEDFDDAPEAGWIFREDQVGKGVAGEACRAALAWFDQAHGPQPIVCAIEIGNSRSFALAERLGFIALRNAEWPDGAAVTLLRRPAAA